MSIYFYFFLHCRHSMRNHLYYYSLTVHAFRRFYVGGQFITQCYRLCHQVLPMWYWYKNCKTVAEVTIIYRSLRIYNLYFLTNVDIMFFKCQIHSVRGIDFMCDVSFVIAFLNIDQPAKRFHFYIIVQKKCKNHVLYVDMFKSPWIPITIIK